MLFVAFVTSGRDLLRQPGAWYAAIVPPLYAGGVGAYALHGAKRRLSAAVAIALHLPVLPALVLSFLGLGLLLPIFTVLWWWMTRAEVARAGA